MIALRADPARFARYLAEAHRALLPQHVKAQQRLDERATAAEHGG